MRSADNNQALNVEKIKKIKIVSRKSSTTHCQLTINGSTVEVVKGTRFLGAHVSDELSGTNSITPQIKKAPQYRSPSPMAAATGGGLHGLLSALQVRGSRCSIVFFSIRGALKASQSCEDAKSTISVLSVLDELLSAGTDRRFYYLISQGGSESILQALVKVARTSAPDRGLLLPLLHLLAKVGFRDHRIGEKAAAVGAELLTLTLLKKSMDHARTAAACLWVLRGFCSSASTATLLGKNGCLDIVFKLISPHTTKHTRTVKAAIDAFAGLFHSKANGRRAAAEGYISGLLMLYEDWHREDALENSHVPIRRALLHCLHLATGTRAGRAALLEAGGLGTLLRTVQSCVSSEGGASCLVEPTVQLMRKCYPQTPVPIISEWSAYSYPLPGGHILGSEAVPGDTDEILEEDSEDDSENCSSHDNYKLLRRVLVLILSGEPSNGQINRTEAGNSDSCSKLDLETDLDRLQIRPEPHRAQDQLGQYIRLCPELHHDFQDLDPGLEKEESSDEEASLIGERIPEGGKRDAPSHPKGKGGPDGLAFPWKKETPPVWRGGVPGEDPPTAFDFLSFRLRSEPEKVTGLLQRHRASVPGQNLRQRLSAFISHSTPAFPDLWGHLPPQREEPTAERTPSVQRKKVFEDIQRILRPEDIINKVVFDLEGVSSSSPNDSDCLQFDSRFESGNLRKVVQVRRHEYDLILNADANSSEHHQWFYFEVSGMQSHVSYRFNIINCEKANSQFNYGMQPVLYSVQEALEGRPGWVRAGSEICYYRNHFLRRRGRKGSAYYTLTFSITFQHEEDVCYLAYHYPYTYSMLQAHLQILRQSVDHRKVFFWEQSLCSSLGGNSCPLVTITAYPASHSWTHLHQLRNRPYVVLTARVHPGESNASWVMKGSLEFLCSEDPAAQALREAYIFKVIPMLNPDGVISGSHRCSLSGMDLNRQWVKPDATLSPTIYHTKGLLSYLASVGRSPLVFCDYHGHSRKKNFFLYGCSAKETLQKSGCGVPVAGLQEDIGYQTIPQALDGVAPAFSLASCSFVVERSREPTARVVLWREMGVLRSYTMESTYNGCNQGLYKGLQVGTQQLEEMGAHFCRSLLSLRKRSLAPSGPHIQHTPILLDKDDSLHDHKIHNAFEEDEPPCAESIEYRGVSGHASDSLDSEVDANVSSSEEEEDEEEEKIKGSKQPPNSEGMTRLKVSHGGVLSRCPCH
ncbi:cytosolic carboxypeptidase 4 [Brienomyrus brachyistius]|uniref:cytosolic carboxypeptidase 4 n=1 Tax=Brienomyrus brachyistius TaxID=42636 RepID=UPI0020B1BA52|nr:cytosolic carboxypeptidase 4 [Brienomyrus brachyistius]